VQNQEIATLVKRVQKGDEIALFSLVDSFSGIAFAMSYSLLGNAEDAEEVAQDALMSAIDKLPQLRKPGSFKAWLLSIVRNASIDKLRSRPTTQPLADGDLPLNDSVESKIHVKEALSLLEEQHRLPLMLFYFDGYSAAAVAETLNISLDAAYARLSRARKQLREVLEPSSGKENCDAL